MNLAFENELIITRNWIPQNDINWEIASKAVLDIVSKRFPKIIEGNGAGEELDAWRAK